MLSNMPGTRYVIQHARYFIQPARWYIIEPYPTWQVCNKRIAALYLFELQGFGEIQ